MPGKITPTNAVTTQPSSSKETKPEIGKLGPIRVKPVEYKCSTVDWIRFGAATCGFSTLGCMTGAALPLVVAFACGSLSPLGLACLSATGTAPGFIGLIGSHIYIADTPTK